MPAPDTYDVLITGGGLAGGSLALQLLRRQPGLKVAVCERRAGPAPEAAFKVGESTVEIGARYFREVLGLADHLVEEQLYKFGLRYFFTATPGAAFGDRFEFGGAGFWEVRSHQLDRGRLENEILRQVAAAGGTVLQGGEVTTIDLDSAGGHRVTLADGRLLRGRWLADASGRKALLKRQLGLSRDNDHDVNAAWFRYRGRISLGDWCQDPAWQERVGEDRWLSTNHLMGPGYWVWLIPLGSGCTSVGIVADQALHPLSSYNTYDKALDWLRRHEPECAVACAGAGEPMDFLVLRHFSHDCPQVFGKRWSLAGECGMFLDPFYSPGSDFIAMGNTLATDLILREFKGEDTSLRSELYNRLLQTFFRNWLSLYQGRYPAFGNARVMVAKVAWDFAWYWSVPAAYAFAERLTDLTSFARHRQLLEGLIALNQRVQDLLMAWHAADAEPAPPGFAAIDRCAWLRRLNRGLVEDLGDAAFSVRLEMNAEELRRAADEIAAWAQARVPGLPWKNAAREPGAALLDELFAPFALAAG